MESRLKQNHPHTLNVCSFIVTWRLSTILVTKDSTKVSFSKSVPNSCDFASKNVSN